MAKTQTPDNSSDDALDPPIVAPLGSDAPTEEFSPPVPSNDVTPTIVKPASSVEPPAPNVEEPVAAEEPTAIWQTPSTQHSSAPPTDMPPPVTPPVVKPPAPGTGAPQPKPITTASGAIKPADNPYAIIALFSGIAAIPLLFAFGIGIVPGIMAVVAGHIAIRQIKANDRAATGGATHAKIGLGLGYGSIALGLIMALVTGIAFIATTFGGARWVNYGSSHGTSTERLIDTRDWGHRGLVTVTPGGKLVTVEPGQGSVLELDETVDPAQDSPPEETNTETPGQ